MSKPKLIIICTVLIDVIGMGIIIPILPFYVEAHGMGPFMMTLLFSVFSLCAFFSGPLMGRLSDRYGRRPILLISLLSTSLGWFIFAAAPSILWLFIGRIVDGLAAGNFPIAQSYLSDISKDAKERTANLGLMGAAFGIGFIIGPALGSLLSQVSYSFPFYAVGIMALANTIVGYFILPETHTNRAPITGKLNINPISPLYQALKDKELRPSYAIWFLFGLAAAAIQAIMTLYLKEVFGFDEGVSGIFITLSGVILAFNQGVALKHFWLKHFAEAKLELWFLLAFGVALILQGLDILWLFIIGAIATSFMQSVLRVVINSQIVSNKPREKHGETLGVMASIISLSMIIGPALSGWLFNINMGAPFYLAAVFMFIAFAIALVNRKYIAKTKLQENQGDELLKGVSSI